MYSMSGFSIYLLLVVTNCLCILLCIDVLIFILTCYSYRLRPLLGGSLITLSLSSLATVAWIWLHVCCICVGCLPLCLAAFAPIRKGSIVAPFLSLHSLLPQAHLSISFGRERITPLEGMACRHSFHWGSSRQPSHWVWRQVIEILIFLLVELFLQRSVINAFFSLVTIALLLYSLVQMLLYRGGRALSLWLWLTLLTSHQNIVQTSSASVCPLGVGLYHCLFPQLQTRIFIVCFSPPPLSLTLLLLCCSLPTA